MIVGLTGGVGSGKSTVLGMFRKLGCRVMSADDIAHDVLRNNKKVRSSVLKVFGKGVLSRTGAINRKELGRRIFADNTLRRKLELIVHPVIIGRLKRILSGEKARKGILVSEVPLLFETGMSGVFDRTVVVYAPEKVMIERIRSRNKLSLKEARDRVGAQMPLREKKKLADFVINSGTGKDLYRQVKSVFDTLSRK